MSLDTPPDSSQQTSKGAPRREMYINVASITTFTFISRVLGLVREIALSHRYGASASTDAWIQAFRVPSSLRRLTAEGAMLPALIPVYTRLRQTEGYMAAKHFAQSVLTWVVLVCSVLVGLGMLFSESLVTLISPGFVVGSETWELTVLLMRWSFPYLLLISCVAWAMGVLNSEGHFAIPAASSILWNLSVIVAVVVWGTQLHPAIFAVAIAVLVGGTLQILSQIPTLLLVGVSPLPRFRQSPAISHFLNLLVPGVLGLLVYELNGILMGILCSYLPTGQIFHFSNASRLNELVIGLFAFAFSNASLPRLSTAVTEKNWEKAGDILRLTWSGTSFIVLPAMIGLFCASEGIVSMIYMHGAFSYADALSTSASLQWMALSIPAAAAVKIINSTFYAFNDAKKPAWGAVSYLLTLLAVGWYFNQHHGLVGLTIATTISMWGQCIISAWWQKNKTAHMLTWFPLQDMLKQAISAFLMGFMVWHLHKLGNWELGITAWKNGFLLATILASGMTLYLGLTLALNETQAKLCVRVIKRVTTKLLGHNT